MRASRRLNSSRESGPVSWVERIRSVGAWKLPTLSAREWRSATLDALGANGSWTLTTSSASVVSASSIVRATSTGSDAARRRAGANGSTSPTPSTTGSPPAARSSSARRGERSARRLSRTSAAGLRRARSRAPGGRGRELARRPGDVLVDLVRGPPRRTASPARSRGPLWTARRQSKCPPRPSGLRQHHADRRERRASAADQQSRVLPCRRRDARPERLEQSQAGRLDDRRSGAQPG